MTFLKISCFDSIQLHFKKVVRVRFGSTLFFESQFEFGSVQICFLKVRSSSVRFGSNRTEPKRTSSTQFGSFSLSAQYQAQQAMLVRARHGVLPNMQDQRGNDPLSSEIVNAVLAHYQSDIISKL
jgi:hypothetical protein